MFENSVTRAKKDGNDCYIYCMKKKDLENLVGQLRWQAKLK